MIFSHKRQLKIVCFMIFWQVVDIVLSALSLLDIVAMAYIKSKQYTEYQFLHQHIKPTLTHPSFFITFRQHIPLTKIQHLSIILPLILHSYSFFYIFVEKNYASLICIYHFQKSSNSNKLFKCYYFITMSKQRKTQVKDNNISSKLLGANLSDINIQKFRDISQLRKQKYDIGGKINVSILKTLSNKFSPEVIFTITLPGQSIANIDALSQCTNLMVLNLSKNSIENVAPLKNLTKLRIVDLSENCIPNIEGIGNCSDLVNLNLEGNMIKGIDQLRSLKTCNNLRNLHLQSLGGNNQNPICSLSNYRANITNEFSQIKRLDCIPISMTQFANGSEIKQTKKKDLKIDIKNIGPFYTNKFPTVPTYTAPVFPDEQGLKKSISSCKSALQDLEVRMRALLTL